MTASEEPVVFKNYVATLLTYSMEQSPS
jgi:hypothetical protein